MVLTLTSTLALFVLIALSTVVFFAAKRFYLCDALETLEQGVFKANLAACMGSLLELQLSIRS